MENFALRETPAQREMWKRKILELREDAQSIRRQGEHYDRMVSSGVRQRRERDELLARRRNNRTIGGGGGRCGRDATVDGGGGFAREQSRDDERVARDWREFVVESRWSTVENALG